MRYHLISTKASLSINPKLDVAPRKYFSLSMMSKPHSLIDILFIWLPIFCQAKILIRSKQKMYRGLLEFLYVVILQCTVQQTWNTPQTFSDRNTHPTQKGQVIFPHHSRQSNGTLACRAFTTSAFYRLTLNFLQAPDNGRFSSLEKINILYGDYENVKKLIYNRLPLKRTLQDWTQSDSKKVG